MSHTLRIEIDRPLAEVIERTKESLAESGFGVLTEIDLKGTLKKKIDVDIDEQVILGACNPHFAHRGLEVEPTLGVLLPCNVVVRRGSSGTIVEAVDPHTMVAATDNPALAPLADEVAALLAAALERVAALA